MENVDPDDVRRTSLHCHGCSKDFIAELNLNLDGNHVIVCPRCGHEHCRVVEDGEVTGERWDSRYNDREVEANTFWKSDDTPAQTSAAHHFIRQAWLDRTDVSDR